MQIWLSASAGFFSTASAHSLLLGCPSSLPTFSLPILSLVQTLYASNLCIHLISPPLITTSSNPYFRPYSRCPPVSSFPRQTLSFTYYNTCSTSSSSLTLITSSCCLSTLHHASFLYVHSLHDAHRHRRCCRDSAAPVRPLSHAGHCNSHRASCSFSALCHNPQLTVVTASFPSPASLHRHPVLLVKQPYTQPLFPASYAPPAGSSQPLRHLQLVGFLLPSSSKLLLTPHRRWPLSLGNHVFASCCLSILTARLLLIPSSQLTSSQPHHLATAACSTLNSPLPSCFQSAQHPPSAQLLSFISMHACHNHGSLPCHTASFGSRLGFLLLLLL